MYLGIRSLVNVHVAVFTDCEWNPTDSCLPSHSSPGPSPAQGSFIHHQHNEPSSASHFFSLRAFIPADKPHLDSFINPPTVAKIMKVKYSLGLSRPMEECAGPAHPGIVPTHSCPEKDCFCQRLELCLGAGCR